MSSIQCLLTVLYSALLLKIARTHEFQVVSTTQLPSGSTEKSSCSVLEELSNRLELLETQSKVMERSCASTRETLNSHFDRLQKEMENKLEEFATKLATKQSELINSLDDKLQKLEDRISSEFSKTIENEFLNKINNTSVEKFHKPAQNCLDIKTKTQVTSGTYKIEPTLGKPLIVYCDLETNGGGWIVILRRFDGSQSFDFGWRDYKNGFGNSNGELWLGLEHIYELTNFENYELIVNLVDWNNKKAYASYETFKIGSEEEGYSLKVAKGYSGDAGDGLSKIVGMKFTTKDKDQDTSNRDNCAKFYKGAWWHRSCYIDASKLTGNYIQKSGTTFTAEGIHWMTLHHGTLKEAKMMIRPRN